MIAQILNKPLITAESIVSQCFSAGGVEQVGVWYIVFHAGTGTWNRSFAGSIMYYPTSLTDEAHVGIITSNDGQTAYYSAHTTDHCNKKMSDYYKTVMDFYIPVWDSHTGTWTSQ